MSLPARILVLLLALLVAFAAGWGAAIRKAARDALQDQLHQSEANREVERLAARNMTRISDALTQDRLRSERAATDAAGRLRDLAATAPPATAACARGDAASGPAVWVLRGQDREDLVALAREADAVADRLRACQRELSGSEPAATDPATAGPTSQ